MPLKTGERVNVPIEFEDRELTTSLNDAGVYGRSENLQTVPFSVYDDGDPTYTFTVDDPVIITGVSLQVSADDSAGGFSGIVTVNIAGENAGRVSVDGTNGYDNQITFIPIPNWRLEKGQEIIISRSGSGDSGSATVIGYYA